MKKNLRFFFTVLALAFLLLVNACAPLEEFLNQAMPVIEEAVIAAEQTQTALDQDNPSQNTLPQEATPTVEDEATITPQSGQSKKLTATPKPKRTATPTAQSADQGDFDYYVLALSWAPDFCASNNDPQQCAIGRRLGFVLHGLWPQYRSGYPSYCSSQKLPAQVKEQFPNLYPNDKLYAHEWEKHGTCSGLSPQEYLALSKQIKESVEVPAAYQRPAEPFRVTTVQLKAAFIEANPDFSTDGLAPSCSGSGRFFSELLVCFAKDGSPTSCGADVQKSSQRSCAQKDYLVRSTR